MQTTTDAVDRKDYENVFGGVSVILIGAPRGLIASSSRY